MYPNMWTLQVSIINKKNVTAKQIFKCFGDRHFYPYLVFLDFFIWNT